MWSPFPLLQSLEACLGLALLAALFLRFLHRSASRTRTVRALYLTAVAVLMAAHAAWALGDDAPWLAYQGCATAGVGLVLAGFVVASLPMAALVRVFLSRALRSESAPAGFTVSRRAFVGAATALVPMGALATAASGFAQSWKPVPAKTVPVVFPDLHPDLDGFTVLQLSDLHLGTAKNLDDLENFFVQLRDSGRRVDLITFTGDVADDVQQVGPALRMAHQFGARHGVLACLGNHEYLHDIEVTRPIFDRSPVPLLVDQGALLRVGGARLYVGGANDPQILGGDIRGFLQGSVDRAMRDAPVDAFRLLLSHRPEGFEAAARRAVHLTLSGHTHGGQIGFNGKSAFEPLWPDGYLWGAYRRGASRLYATSGFGAWFPFRLGCAAEAPLVVLESLKA